MTTEYTTRVAQFRRAFAELPRGRAWLPAHLRDQIQAASRDTDRRMRRMPALLTVLEPERDWHACETWPTSPHADELGARTLAAVVDFRFCPHLRRTLAQPTYARMALRRLDCERCVHTVANPPTDEDDRCDWCGERGVRFFVPVGYQWSMLLVLGNACVDCAAALVPDDGTEESR